MQLSATRRAQIASEVEATYVSYKAAASVGADPSFSLEEEDDMAMEGGGAARLMGGGGALRCRGA